MKNVALVVIDMQKGFDEPSWSASNNTGSVALIDADFIGGKSGWGYYQGNGDGFLHKPAKSKLIQVKKQIQVKVMPELKLPW